MVPAGVHDGAALPLRHALPLLLLPRSRHRGRGRVRQRLLELGLARVVIARAQLAEPVKWRGGRLGTGLEVDGTEVEGVVGRVGGGGVGGVGSGV